MNNKNWLITFVVRLCALLVFFLWCAHPDLVAQNLLNSKQPVEQDPLFVEQEQITQKLSDEIGSIYQELLIEATSDNVLRPIDINNAGLYDYRQRQEDLQKYKNAGAKQFVADLRENKPLHLQLVTSGLILWGVDAGVNLWRNWIIGASWQSAAMLNFIYGNRSKAGFTLKTSSLSSNQETQYTAHYNHLYQEKKLYLRAFPNPDSGFFLQIGGLFREWPGKQEIKIQEYNTYADRIPSAKVALASFHYPKYTVEYQTGWMWVNRSGFSAAFAISYRLANRPTIELSQATDRQGRPVFQPAEEKVLRDAVLDRTPFTQSQWNWVISFGSNF